MHSNGAVKINEVAFPDTTIISMYAAKILVPWISCAIHFAKERSVRETGLNRVV